MFSALKIFSLLISMGSRLLPMRLMKIQHEAGRVSGRKSPSLGLTEAVQNPGHRRSTLHVSTVPWLGSL